MSNKFTHPGFAGVTPKVPFDLVLITWYDAGSDDDWQDIEDYKIDDFISPIVTAGYLLGEDKGMVRLAASLAPDFDFDDTPHVSQQMFIPRAVIKKVDVIIKAAKETT